MKKFIITLFALLLAPAIASAAAPKLKLPPLSQDKANTFVVMSFNILQGGGHAPRVGFPNGAFDGSRKDDIARVITACRADVVGVQEDDGSDGLLKELGRDWHRAGNVYAKHPLTQIAGGVRVHLPNNRLFVVVNTHWWPTGGYGPSVVQKRMEKGAAPQDLDKFEANCLLLRDAGTKLPNIVAINQKYNLKFSCIVDLPVEKGIAQLLNMDSFFTNNLLDYENKALKSIDLLERYDFIYVHLKGPDEAGHDGEVLAKKKKQGMKK